MQIAPSSEFPFIVRGLDIEDEQAVLELLRATLGEKKTTRKTAEYWRWKHLQNTFGSSYTLCAVDPADRALAGLRTMMRWVFKSPSGKFYQAGRAVDTATSPDYQRRGIFSELTARAIEGLRREGSAFIFNTPNQNSLPGYLKMGWKVVERWPVYVRPVRPIRTLVKLLFPPPKIDNRDSLQLYGLINWSRFREQHGAALETIVSSHEHGRSHVGLRTRRDLAYLDWRYGSHPDVEYGAYPMVSSSGVLAGFMIARPATGIRRLTSMTVTEVFLQQPSRTSVRRLFHSAFSSVDCDYWSVHFSEGTVELDAVKRMGFFAAPGRGYTWTSLPLNQMDEDPTAASHWDLTLGEMEIF
ncbi:hypothetical protein BH23GEM6_BH23GEM6_18090 [soil metagenome]